MRSWCAASAMKRRWLSAWAFTSPNSRLSDCTSGRTSSGEPPSSSALRSRGERRSTASFSASSGRSARSTAQPTAIAAAAISTRLGSSTFSRMERAHCWRGSELSAMATATSPTTVCCRWRAMRQVMPSYASLWNSSCDVGRRQQRQPLVADQQLAVGVGDGEGGGAGPLLEELLHARRHHQHQGFVGAAALPDDRVGQQRHQRLQPPVLLQRDVVGGAVREPGIAQRQQHQRHQQHHRQAPPQAGEHALAGDAARRAGRAEIHHGAAGSCSSSR